LAVNKQAAQKFNRERFNLRKLNELKFGKQYQIDILNRFASLDNLRDREDINRNWGRLKKISKPQLKRVQVCMKQNSR